MELQEAIERFLSDTERRRSNVTVKRYREAMELLLSFLAVELMDPEDPGRPAAERVRDLDPEVMHSFGDTFLGNRLAGNDRARRRYLAATRAFVQWLLKNGLIEASASASMLDTLRLAGRSAEPPPSSGDDMAAFEMDEDRPAGEVFFQVIDVRGDRALLMDVESAEELPAKLPRSVSVAPGDLVAGVVERGHGSARVSGLRAVSAEEGLMELEMDEDWDESFDGDEDEDDWSGPDGPLVEDALEILASEDRYAPREVVRIIMGDFDEARDDLLEWLSDDEYRNEPFPGTGEAPANAARLLSEARIEEALPRLMDVLGDEDPLGEEAPMAVARYGSRVIGSLKEIVEDEGSSSERRTAALWSLACVAVRNPASRGQVGRQIMRVLTSPVEELVEAGLSALEDLRMTDCLEPIMALEREGRLDLERYERTCDLVESRIQSDGIGEQLAEVMLPVIYLYPTNEELEEFYESIEEDLGDLWELMDTEDEGDGEDKDAGDDPSEGGKIIPFPRPPF